MLMFPSDRRGDDEPRFFKSPDVEEGKRQIAAFLSMDEEKVFQSDPPLVWKLRIPEEVVAALSERSRGRCAFCEASDTELTAYRFRPPAYATPDLPAMRKASYIWTTFGWSNFFPICSECRPLRPNHFPVRGDRARWDGRLDDDGPRLREQALFYFPGELVDDPTAFAIARIDGELEALGERSAQTIAHFGLNRQRLVDARSMLFEKLIRRLKASLSQRTFEGFRVNLERDLDSAFGGALFLFAQGILLDCARRQEISLPGPIRPEDLPDLYHSLGADILPQTLEAVLDDLRTALDPMPMVPPQTPYVIGPSTVARGSGRLDERLRSVTLSNFKSLEQISVELPAPGPTILSSPSPTTQPRASCLMILGENATGKSSVLEAIAIACLRQSQLDELGLDARSLTLNPEYMGAPSRRPKSLAEIELKFGEDADGPVRSVRVDAAAGRIAVLPEGGPAPLLFAYGAHRLFGVEEREGWERHVDTLFANEKALSNPEPWLRGLWAADRQDRLDEVVSALRHIIQIDGEFEAIDFRGEPGNEACVLRMRRGRPGTGQQVELVQPLKIVSSGYRAVLALVCDVLRGMFEAMPDEEAHEVRMSPAIVLIDEVEAHLHPRWKLGVMTGLRRALPRVTFIVTSHDPLCVRGMFNGEIVALNRYRNEEGEEGALPERVERIDDFDRVETMTVEQLLTSDLFQLVSTDDDGFDRELAGVADILTRQTAGADLTDGEHATLRRFDALIRDGLPVGGDAVTQLVREAVAEFLAERRSGNSAASEIARDRAKEAVKGFLREFAR